MCDIFLIFHSSKHKLLRYFPLFVLFVSLFNGSNFFSNMTMGNKKKKRLRSPQTSHYERRNTETNPSKPRCIFNQLEGLFKENSLRGVFFFFFHQFLCCGSVKTGGLLWKWCLSLLSSASPAGDWDLHWSEAIKSL